MEQEKDHYVLIDTNLLFDFQVYSYTSIVFFSFKKTLLSQEMCNYIKQQQKKQTQKTTTLVNALISTWLDYYNALLSGYTSNFMNKHYYCQTVINTMGLLNNHWLHCITLPKALHTVTLWQCQTLSLYILHIQYVKHIAYINSMWL